MKTSTLLKLNPFVLCLLFTCFILSCDLAKTGSTSGEDGAPTTAEIGAIDIAACETSVEHHHGCYCDFNSEDGTPIFISNMELSKSACLSINGNTEILTGERIDERQDHLRHSYIPDWIVLDANGDVHIFNVLVDDSKDEENADLIYQTMMVMHDLPTDVKIRKDTGENGETVSDELASKYENMWAASLKKATAARAEGNLGAPLEIELSNETFDVYVKAEVANHNEDGSDNYNGTIEVKSKTGEVLGTKDFKGVCMCEK